MTNPRAQFIRLLILIVVLFEARAVWPDENPSVQKAMETDVQATVERSRQARREIEKSTPSRTVAALTEQQQQNAREFEQLERDDSDKTWFDEVDQLIQN